MSEARHLRSCPEQQQNVYWLLIMKNKSIAEDSLISALSYQRQSLLKHAASVLSLSDLPSRAQPTEREAQLSAITLSSLEELKVAEEELTERTAALANLRDGWETRLQAAQQLFELAPPALLVTDIYGTVLEANRAMRQLLHLEPGSLDRQPLARFLPHEARRGFRDGLTRLAMLDGVTDWRMVLVRPTDVPVQVSAVVQVLRGPQTPSGTALYWSFAELPEQKSQPGA